MCKKFGKFPESLASVYIAQVLEGLSFLHEQGTIHRDIKGANILTTKDGLAKLADFGVATNIAKLDDSPSVVGTPNWMAPEVIELHGATTASDIWSLGCTVVELLTGNPPYHHLGQMQAMFAIANNDHFPIPEGISPLVQDFLMQCFQKDPNLRVTAKKLLKHPWVSAHKKKTQTQPTTKYDEAVKTVQKWNEALTNIEDNYAARPKLPVSKKKEKKLHAQILTPDNRTGIDGDPYSSLRNFSKSRQLEFQGMKQRNTPTAKVAPKTECWDDDFSQEDIPKKLNAMAHARKSSQSDSNNSSVTSTDALDAKIDFVHSKTPIGSSKSSRHWKESGLLGKDSPFRDNTQDDFSDLLGDLNIAKLPDSAQKPVGAYHPSDLKGIFSRIVTPEHPLQSPPALPVYNHPELNAVKKLDDHFKTASPLGSFQEDEKDEDYSSLFGAEPIDLQFGNRRFSKVNNDATVPDDDNDAEDPFFEIEREYSEANIVETIARERLAHSQVKVTGVLEELNRKLQNNHLEGSFLISCIEDLHSSLCEFPEVSKTIMKCHGLLLLLEVLENHVDDRNIVPGLLEILLLLLDENFQTLENFCLVGGIPLVAQFTSKKYSSEIRMQAAKFILMLCDSGNHGLPMLLACGGLYILAEFIEEDCATQADFVSIGINGIWSVFEYQGSAPRNDICRKLSKHNVHYSLSVVLKFILFESDNDTETTQVLVDRIISVLTYFSQSEKHVKLAVSDRALFRNLFKSFDRLDTKHQLSVLKFIKNLSSCSEVLPILQNANAIEHLTDILAENKRKPVFKDYAIQILHTMYNLCRLSKVRQEEAATAGIVPILQLPISSEIPLKEFAFPILCDMAHSGKACRKVLWQNKGLETYLKFCSEPSWQVNAFQAIAIWLQEEFAKVEEALLNENAIISLWEGLEAARGTVFDDVLEPLTRIMRSSPAVCSMVASQRLFQLMKKHLDVPRPRLRLDLLKLLMIVLEYFPSKFELVKKSGLLQKIQEISKSDESVLVVELTKDLLNFGNSPTQESFSGNGIMIGRSSSRGSTNSTRMTRSNSFLNSPAIPQNRFSSTSSRDPSISSFRKTHRIGASQPELPSSSQLMMPPKSPTRKTHRSTLSSASGESAFAEPPLNLLESKLFPQKLTESNTPALFNVDNEHDLFNGMITPPSFLKREHNPHRSPTRSPTRTPGKESRRPVDSLKLSNRYLLASPRTGRKHAMTGLTKNDRPLPESNRAQDNLGSPFQ